MEEHRGFIVALRNAKRKGDLKERREGIIQAIENHLHCDARAKNILASSMRDRRGGKDCVRWATLAFARMIEIFETTEGEERDLLHMAIEEVKK